MARRGPGRPGGGMVTHCEGCEGSVKEVFADVKVLRSRNGGASRAENGACEGCEGSHCYLAPCACASGRARMGTSVQKNLNILNKSEKSSKYSGLGVKERGLEPSQNLNRTLTSWVDCADFQSQLTEASTRLQIAGRLVVWQLLAQFFVGISGADLRRSAHAIGLSLRDVQQAGVDW